MKDKNPNWIGFENCRKADKFKEQQPDKYKQLLTRLEELQDCRNQIAELRHWETETLFEIHQLAPPYEATYGGIGKVTVNKSKSKKWDNENIFNVLLARARDARRINKETGEVLESEGQAVRRVIEECAGISYWRMGSLKEYGIDPDEYHEITNAKNAVRIQN